MIRIHISRVLWRFSFFILSVLSLEKITTYIFAERMYTTFDSKKLVNWAIDVLNLGHSSENLYILAGLDNEFSYVREEYFLKSLYDLKLDINLSDDELLDVYALLIAENAVNEKLDLEIAFSKILNVLRISEYDEKYMEFYKISEDLDYLAYENEPIYNTSLNLNNYKEFIHKEFKSFIEKRQKQSS